MGVCFSILNRKFLFRLAIKMVKASKIEGMPKRPMSAYFLWMGAEGREASKECGSMWKEIDEATKKKYEKKQAELKKKYDIEYPKWLADGGKELLDAAKKEKKAKKAKKAAKAAKKAAPKGKGRGRPSKKQAESEEEEEEESEEDDE